MSPSPGAVGPGSRRRRRRYVDPPAAALLTGLGAALGPRAAFGVAMLTRTGCLLPSERAGFASVFISLWASGASIDSRSSSALATMFPRAPHHLIDATLAVLVIIQQKPLIRDSIG